MKKDFKKIDQESGEFFYVRDCPSCGKEIIHKNKTSFYSSRKKNASCRSCSSKGKGEKLRENFELWLQDNPDFYKSENNGFYGKTHTEESRQKQSKAKKGKRMSPETQFKKGDNVGSKNHMHGRSVYDLWVEKHGKEEADLKKEELRIKQSKKSSGKNNPMYGKPSPKGSGNGWSGWYKGWLFRSLQELSFMVGVIERFGFKWESGESKKWRIEYIDSKGTERNYFPDFILNEKYMVECKPKKLWESADVKIKKGVAKSFCKEKSLIYKLIEPIKISKEEIKKLYQEGEIKWTDRYQKKYNEQYK